MPISWSCVARDGIILAEAGSDDGSSSVIRTAKKISSVKPTCGWEETTRSLQNAHYRVIKLHLYVADDDNGELLVWSFCCVYKSKGTSAEIVKAFLSRLVTITEPLRCLPLWREGAALSAQPSFAPSLLQLMESAEDDYKVYV
jgi:hypothetical protein